MVVIGLVGLGQRQLSSLNGFCSRMYRVDIACLPQFLQSLDLVDSVAASLVLRVCKDTCKT